MNKFGGDKRTRLSKVYFVWVIRDFGSAECEAKNLHQVHR
jgi:NADPH oxidase